jgi:ethanolamine ammonia-lyase small subunit
MEEKSFPVFQLDSELTLKKNLSDYTFARINLSRAGFSTSMSEVLAFRADYAAAKDAIFTPFEVDKLQKELKQYTDESIILFSEAKSKAEYLQRPDLGRMLNSEGFDTLKKLKGNYDIVIVITDGLSAQAVNLYAVQLLEQLLPKLKQTGYTLAPLIFIHNGRVAIADAIGETLNAKLSIILLGERPGLSSPDSMGAYITYAPQKGLTDEKRNCVSNIRDKGLPIPIAANKLFYLISEALTKKISGVNLKDDMGLLNE